MNFKLKLLSLLPILALSVTCAENKGLKEQINWTSQINLPGGFHFKWLSTDPSFLTMEISAPTKGYVGVGFSTSDGMEGSDIALGWVDSTGKPHFKDYHGTENGAPTEDSQQDYELLDAKENDNGTTFIIRRKWDTCDKQDLQFGGTSLRLIWAWHEEDPKDNELHWHGSDEHRGYIPLNQTFQIPADILLKPGCTVGKNLTAAPVPTTAATTSTTKAPSAKTTAKLTSVTQKATTRTTAPKATTPAKTSKPATTPIPPKTSTTSTTTTPPPTTTTESIEVQDTTSNLLAEIEDSTGGVSDDMSTTTSSPKTLERPQFPYLMLQY